MHQKTRILTTILIVILGNISLVQAQTSFLPKTVEQERAELANAFQKKDELASGVEKTEEPIIFDALHQEYQESDDIFIGWGYVRVQQGKEFVLEAKEVLYQQWTGQVAAKGNVVIHFGEKDIITGTRAEFNLFTGLGTVFNCKAYLDRSEEHTSELQSH